MPYIEIKLDWQKKLSDLSQATIGRRPVAFGDRGRSRVMEVEFDPPLTVQERTDLLNALPEWIRKLYSFEVKTGTLRQSP